jgi:putative transposase
MDVHSQKAFYDLKIGLKVVDEDKFRFETSVFLVEEWLKRKLRVRNVVERLAVNGEIKRRKRF